MAILFCLGSTCFLVSETILTLLDKRFRPDCLVFLHVDVAEPGDAGVQFLCLLAPGWNAALHARQREQTFDRSILLRYSCADNHITQHVENDHQYYYALHDSPLGRGGKEYSQD